MRGIRAAASGERLLDLRARRRERLGQLLGVPPARLGHRVAAAAPAACHLGRGPDHVARLHPSPPTPPPPPPPAAAPATSSSAVPRSGPPAGLRWSSFTRSLSRSTARTTS